MLNRIDLSRVDLNLLVLFEAVLEERHVGRAAARLSLTPSAVSHGLGRLRRLLDDPVFLRTPRGVTPTARALDLALPIAEALARVRGVLALAAPFDPARSTRRFVLGGPDGVLAVLAPPLRARLAAEAPGVDLGLRPLLPAPGEMAPGRAWAEAFAELDARRLDAALLPVGEAPARFWRRRVYDEDFVVAMRAGHPLAAGMTLDGFCAAGHVVVSASGDPEGFVDLVLAEVGRRRRVALTAPNFAFALLMLGETGLVAAAPRRFATRHAGRLGLVWREAPLPLGSFAINVVAPAAAMHDAGLAWMLDRIALGDADA
ncbi:LysR family transcriptional regulator [Amaricoccus sp.]|uniref:LysR family transcriptional regulator n=1 Tax=Amaricoccus sp. TaxID=1872485 RepID=UPI001B67398C|nr:LysR family transcriptional regulator [Amaricoccus sp.]MBP7001062.1 LysR family transcriptional regulator [Amaricoccus sp.]